MLHFKYATLLRCVFFDMSKLVISFEDNLLCQHMAYAPKGQEPGDPLSGIAAIGSRKQNYDSSESLSGTRKTNSFPFPLGLGRWGSMVSWNLSQNLGSECQMLTKKFIDCMLCVVNKYLFVMSNNLDGSKMLPQYPITTLPQ